jgi:hypothetical protein
MDTIHMKLNEHIIYLQNELRKRDEMLDDNCESDSDFDQVSQQSVLDDDFDSPNKNIQSQVSSSMKSSRRNSTTRIMDSQSISSSRKPFPHQGRTSIR